jgi:hypothetical protein
MNKIYFSKITKALFLILGMLSFNFSFSENGKGKSNLPYAFIAGGSDLTLSWKRNSVIPVVVVIGENANEAMPGNFEDYTAKPEYRKGSGIGSSYVAYKGNVNKVDLTGLTKGSNYFVWVYETDASGALKNITDEVFRGGETAKATNATPVVCAAIGGITCTLNGTTSSGYIAGSAPCNAAPFGTTNPWDGAGCTGFVSFTYSSPVSTSNVRMIAVNSGVDFTTISQSGGTGGALTVSGLICMNAAGLVLGPYTGPGSYGDVAATITSTGSYLTITCTNTGCNSGWVAACPTIISTLPVEMVSFTAECSIDDVVDLKWRTISEHNNDFFSIERSTDTRNWETVGQVKGAGTTTQSNSYNFIDKQRFNKTMYYRIKQTDFGGEFDYSEMVSVRSCKAIGGSIDEVSLYPNPTSNEFTVNSNSDATVLEIYNTLGVLVSTKNLSSGENTISTSDLSSGTYYVKVTDATRASKMTRLVVNP